MDRHQITTQLNDRLNLASLTERDAEALAGYFDGLSPASRARFQPHPLTRQAALQLCAETGASTIRLVLRTANEIIGYFILEPRMSVHEAGRFATHGIALESMRDLLFAPSIADAYQNQGYGSMAMPHLIDLARRHRARSLVLMGGTQATNARAIAFYEKFGFERIGGYWTDVFNHDMRLVLEPA